MSGPTALVFATGSAMSRGPLNSSWRGPSPGLSGGELWRLAWQPSRTRFPPTRSVNSSSTQPKRSGCSSPPCRCRHSFHVRHVATHEQRRRFAVFAQRWVGLARPRNDTGVFPHQSLRGPYRPVLGLLLGRPKGWLEVASLIAVKSGDNDQLRGVLLREDAVWHLDALPWPVIRSHRAYVCATPGWTHSWLQEPTEPPQAPMRRWRPEAPSPLPGHLRRSSLWPDQQQAQRPWQEDRLALARLALLCLTGMSHHRRDAQNRTNAVPALASRNPSRHPCRSQGSRTNDVGCPVPWCVLALEGWFRHSRWGPLRLLQTLYARSEQNRNKTVKRELTEGGIGSYFGSCRILVENGSAAAHGGSAMPMTSPMRSISCERRMPWSHPSINTQQRQCGPLLAHPCKSTWRISYHFLGRLYPHSTG